MGTKKSQQDAFEKELNTRIATLTEHSKALA